MQEPNRTNPATIDVLVYVIKRKLYSPVYLTSCSALSTDTLPVLIDTMFRSSFLLPPDRSVFRRTECSNFQTHMEDKIPFDTELHNGMAKKRA
jgi:hypothetical protein